MPIPRDVGGKSAPPSALAAMPFFSPGDTVVGEYTETGRVEKPSTVLGESEEVKAKRARMIEHALRLGGKPLGSPTEPTQAPTPEKQAEAPTIPKRRGRPPKARPAPVSDTILHPSPTIPTSYPIEVVFSTQVGRIKLNAEAAIEIDSALLLVFSNESEIRYEPEAGTEVQLMFNKKVMTVMYPGFKFPWTDGDKRLLVYVKLPDAE